MTPIEQAIEALEEAKAIDARNDPEGSLYTEQLDRALAALRSMEGKEPVMLSDEEIERIGSEQQALSKMAGLDDADLGPEYFIGFRAGLRHSRDNGYVAPSPSEPRLTVGEVMEVVSGWVKWTYDDDLDDQFKVHELRGRLTKAAKP